MVIIRFVAYTGIGNLWLGMVVISLVAAIIVVMVDVICLVVAITLVMLVIRLVITIIVMMIVVISLVVAVIVVGMVVVAGMWRIRITTTPVGESCNWSKRNYQGNQDQDDYKKGCFRRLYHFILLTTTLNKRRAAGSFEGKELAANCPISDGLKGKVNYCITWKQSQLFGIKIF